MGEPGEIEESKESQTPPGSSRRYWLFAVAVVLVATALGVGAYLYGKNSGEDLAAAEARGGVVGEKAGTMAGRKLGYAKGLKEGRERGYEQTYDDAYRRAYSGAFEEADLDPPQEIKVPSE